MNENGQKLQEHINAEVQSDIKQLYKHAEIANAEMSAIKIDIAQIKGDLGWLKKFFWLVSGSSVGALLTGIFNLLLK